MLCAKIHSSHQKEQHWKQYKVWALRLLQFPHFTFAVLHSFIAKTSSKLFIRKLVGSSLGFPLPAMWNCLMHSGDVILRWTPLVRWIPFRQWRQKLCKQGNCFGSVNVHIHTEQDTSSWRLPRRIFISMEKVENKHESFEIYSRCGCRWSRRRPCGTKNNESLFFLNYWPRLTFILLANQIRCLDVFWCSDVFSKVKNILYL